MEDDINLDELESQSQEKLKTKNRFQELSDKVANTSKERDDAIAKAEAEAQAKAQIEKERDFYKDFSINVTKYPNASEYQDKILEKVRGGYSTEDAMIAVLAKEGKLNYTPEAHAPEYNQPEGGSAPTTLTGDKNIEDMKTEEKFAALAELDKTGALSNALRGRA